MLQGRVTKQKDMEQKADLIKGGGRGKLFHYDNDMIKKKEGGAREIKTSIQITDLNNTIIDTPSTTKI